MTILTQTSSAFAHVLCLLILYSFPWRTGCLGMQKAHCISVPKEAYSTSSFSANCQDKTKDVTYYCHQDVWILRSKHVMPLTGHCFFALIYNKHSFDVIVSVIFRPGLQVPIKFPFLQNNCGPGNHHHSLPLLLPARLWLPGPQQIQYHWFPLTATAVMMTSRKHWNWQKMLK